MPRRNAIRPLLCAALILVCVKPFTLLSQDTAAQARPEPFYFIREYRVSGSTLLSSLEVSKVVYPYLGPGRRAEDIEKARQALEKAFHERGYQAVSVSIPPQTGRRGIIRMEVAEARIGSLHVNGAKWHLPSSIRNRAPSLAPGTPPNFENIQRDIVALNKSADMKVTPRLTPSEDPRFLDIELDVEDKAPFHGSIELNNRYSPNTVPLRINGSLSYANLWLLGHTLGLSFQVAPERIEDGEVYSGYYSMPVSDNTSLTLSGMKQSSDINTLGNSAVVGQGVMAGLRLNHDLPMKDGFMHSLSWGFDFKDFKQNTRLGDTGSEIRAPVRYWPFSMTYNAFASHKNSFTSGSLAVNWAFRGSSERQQFDDKRYNADGGFIYLRGELSHLHDLPGGWQAFIKGSGQVTGDPLINNEQFAAGGQGSVRGYLASAALGDKGVTGTLEFRSPSLLGPRRGKNDDGTPSSVEWRLHAFADAGWLSINDSLPEQRQQWSLASLGVGSEFRLWDHWHAVLDAGFPLLDMEPTRRGDLMLSFRLWSEF